MLVFGVVLLFASALVAGAGEKVVNVGLKHKYLPLRHSTFNPILRRKLDDAAPNNNRMDGNILPVGIYWMSVDIGTPPQHFSAAVDSGSGDLIVPSTTCIGCHDQNTGDYIPNASTTSVPVPCNQTQYKCHNCTNGGCTFSNTYETCNLTAPNEPCTVTGPLYYDSFAIGGLPGKTVFGAIAYQTKNFQQFFNIDAVIGFIPHASSWNGQSPFQTLVDAGEVSNIYAMCMSPTNGGVITLGGVDDSLRSGEFMYTPQTAGFGYQIRLKDILVGGQSVGVSVFASKLIVDSGTNVLLQRTQNFQRIQSALIAQMCTPPNVFTGPGVCNNNNDFFNQVCYPYTEEQRAQFPNVSLVVDDAVLVMQGPDYVVPNGTTGQYCFGIKDTGAVGLDIIGDVVMQNYYVSFDNDKRTLGWAPVNATNCMAVHNKLTTPSRTIWEEVKAKATKKKNE